MFAVLNMSIKNYKIKIKMNKETFTIWIAGFYEGEGTIANDITNSNRLRLYIYQNDPTPFEKTKEYWGGTIRKRTRKSPASDKICTNYEWSLSHCDALKFIVDIKPYMNVPYKIQQMENAINVSKEKFVRKFKCNFCENEYASPSGRRRHEKNTHINTDASPLQE